MLAKDSPPMLTALILLAAAQAANPSAATTAVVQTTLPATLREPDVRSMKPRDIKAFNQTVPTSHPYHIRCVHQVDIGSLVSGTTTCKTNQQWVKAENVGNDDARDIGDKLASKFTEGN